MPLFIEHLSAADFSHPTVPRTRLVQAVVEHISDATRVVQSRVRERLAQEVRQQGVTYEILLNDHRITGITRIDPSSPPSPFDEHFEQEITLPTSKGALGNPYKAKATPEMMVLLRSNGEVTPPSSKEATSDSTFSPSPL